MTRNMIVKFALSASFVAGLTACDVNGDGKPDFGFDAGACMEIGHGRLCIDFDYDGSGGYDYCDVTDAQDPLAADFAQDWCPGLVKPGTMGLDIVLNTYMETWDHIDFTSYYVDETVEHSEWVNDLKVTLINDWTQWDQRVFLSTANAPAQGQFEIEAEVVAFLESGEEIHQELFCPDGDANETVTVRQNGTVLRATRMKGASNCYLHVDFNVAGTGEEKL